MSPRAREDSVRPRRLSGVVVRPLNFCVRPHEKGMRKQYHFRPGPSGTRAWDVDRLVALARHLQPQLVPVATIRELDEAYWSESMTPRNLAEHARLIAEADLAYPIILSSNGRVMDGMHRVLKALMQGEMYIPAVRFAVDPPPDFEGVNPDDLPYEEKAETNDQREV